MTMCTIMKMQVNFTLNETKVNSLKISLRKIFLDKSKTEVLDTLEKVILAAIDGIDNDIIHTVLVISARKWEKMTVKPINSFRFMHADDRMKAFDQIIGLFIAALGDIILEQPEQELSSKIRKVLLTNYKEYLEDEGYVVTYKF